MKISSDRNSGTFLEVLGRAVNVCAWPRRVALLVIVANLFLPCVGSLAQEPADPATVKLNFPEQVDLKLLIEYVSTRLDIKILYDEGVSNKKITIKAPNEIPAESLLNLLESALKMKGLALVDADVAGWKQIVDSRDLTQIAQPRDGESLQDVEGTVAVTQAFTLSHVDPQKLSQIIKPFLTEPGANTITVPEQNLLIITDYARNLERISKLVDTIDTAGPPSVLAFYDVMHVEAAALAGQVSQVLGARAKTQAIGGERFDVMHDERTNKLVLVGPQLIVDQILQLLKTLDVPLGLTTEVYTFEYVAAERIDNLVKELFDPLTIKRLYRSAIDAEDNLLIVTAPKKIHERIGWLTKQMDLESKRPGSSVKFFKLKNANAEEVIQTLQAIQQNRQTPFGAQGGLNNFSGGARGISPLGRGPTGAAGYSLGQPFRNQFVPGANFPGTPGQVLPTQPPAFQSGQQAGQQPVPTLQQTGRTAEISSLPDSARITADLYTNSIIVVGDKSAQEIYKNLIEFLDVKRPQVMIEAQVVIIDTSDDYSIGVELSAGDRAGVNRLFEFTSFGLSAVDPVSGALSLIPGQGLNWALVNPEDGDAVLRALATHRRARVLSVPRVLVNDNSTGTLASVTEVPFTSVNASNTVATTSFAGFAEAGTTIEVTPRISENDHLVLDYVVTLNTFTGTGGAGVPPPRQTDEIRSTVTIPDGHTIIVGGLNRQNTSWSRNGERIPFLRELTGSETDSKSRTTLFVFLRPVILRDDKFRDLQYLSDKSLNCAGCRKKNYPSSTPMLIR